MPRWASRIRTANKIEKITSNMIIEGVPKNRKPWLVKDYAWKTTALGGVAISFG
jgi:hypothetical protein